MAELDWQLGIALLCVAGALVVLLRRVRSLLGGKSGCGPSGCGSCSSKPTLVNLGETKGFVSLESLERARSSGPDFTHAIKSDGKPAAKQQLKQR